MLTEKQVKTYKQDGYLKVEGLFTSEEVNRIGYHTSEMRSIGLDVKEPNNKIIVSGLKKRREEPRLTYR